MDNEIFDIWNGEIAEETENTYVIKNDLWNHDIKEGQKASFGFTAKYNDDNEIDIPESFSIPSKKTDVSEKDYEIQYTIINQWQTGFTSEIELTNTSNQVIEDWSLQFQTTDITDFSFDNAVLVSSDNELYEIHNTFANMHLLPEESIRLQITGKKDKTHTNPTMDQFKLIQIGYDGNEVDPEDELIDIGEIYFKDIQDDEDVLFNGEGLYYVKNQLLISGVLANNYVTFEMLAEEIDASIVGYIELTNDYQIEFNKPMEYTELEDMIDYLSSFSFIEDVSLNTVLKEENDYIPNDTEYENETWDEDNPSGLNWGAEAIRASSAWDYKDEMQTVKVGVIDYSFFEDHEDLNFVKVWNNTKDMTNVEDDKIEHGNHVAGIMAAGFDNGRGIAGISPNNQLYAYALYGGDNSSEMNFTTVMEYKYAYALLIGNNVKVINVSMGSSGEIVFAASRGNANAINYLDTNAKILQEFLHKLLIKNYDFLIVNSAGNEEEDYFVHDDDAYYGYVEYDDSEDDFPPDVEKYSGDVPAMYNSFLGLIDSYQVKSRIVTVGAFGTKVNINNYRTNYYSSFSNTGDRVDIAAPGERIHSTIYPTNTDDEPVYGEKRGTSMAAPHVAGVAAMIYGVEPSLSGYQVKNILTSSNSTEVKDAHGNLYPILDALASVEKAIDIRGSTPPTAPPTGILMGRVVDKNDNVMTDADVTVYRTSIGDSNLENYSSNIKTDENGNFEFILAEGSYNVIISKDGYLPVVINDVSIVPESVEYLENTILVDGTSNLFKSIGVLGNVSNALTGSEISNATIKFRKGWNTTEGEYVKGLFGIEKSVKTDNAGAFDISLPKGNYTAEISKDGFVIGHYNVFSSKSDKYYNLVLTPILSDDEYRIVLTWGSTPKDLDSLLFGTLDSGEEFQVYYNNKSYTLNGKTVAKLDIDARNGYGPETITLSINDDILKKGVYQYSVLDYTNINNPTSKELSMSGASVKLYKGNELIRTFNVPINAQGNLWTVFTIENGVLKTS